VEVPLRVQLPRKQLSDALSNLERVIPNRSSNAALTFLKVSTTDQGLSLSGTNLEIDLEIFVPAQIVDGLTFVVPAHLFAQVTKALPGELAELHLEQGELTVASGGATFKLQTGELGAYPELTFPTHTDLTIDARELAKSIQSVRYAAAAEEFRAIFRGVQLELSPQRSRVVATDGFRLAYRDFVAASVSEPRKIVIPARNADELVRILRDGEVNVTLGNGQVTISSLSARMNAKLMDGELPDYERVIPASSAVSIELDAATLRDSVARVAVVADKQANNKVEFIASEGRLQLIAESDFGRAQDSLEVVQSGSEPAITVGFRAKQLTDALGPVDGTVTIGLGVNAPAVFRAASDPGYLAIVNPLRV
jgi:DNA polymerase III subunit beta